MKLLITIIFLIPAICLHGQTNYDKIQNNRIANLEKWHKMDSLNIVWLKKGKTADSARINTLTTQHLSQQSQINSLLTLTAAQAKDINNLNTVVISHGTQIRALQDSLTAIPFVLVDTVKIAGKQSLTFRINTLSVTK